MTFLSYILLAFLSLLIIIFVVGRISAKTAAPVAEPTPDIDFIIYNLRGSIIQILETVNILETTVNIDTFASRLLFLRERVKSIYPYVSNDIYRSAFDEGISLYHEQYPNILISELQREILASPLIINTDDFNAMIKTNFFKRYCERIYNEMEKLKQDTAKERRRKKVMETAKIILSQLDISQKNYHQIVVEQLKRFNVKLKLRYKEDK